MIEKLRQLKKDSHMTNQQIAEKSNIPESTVARIFSGKTPNPTVSTVISMVRAMDCSAGDLLNEFDNQKTNNTEENTSDEGAEVSPAVNGKCPNCSESNSACLHTNDSQPSDEVVSNEKIYEEMISLYRDELQKKYAWIKKLFWCMVGIALFILFVLIFDILHPSFGFVKY